MSNEELHKACQAPGAGNCWLWRKICVVIIPHKHHSDGGAQTGAQKGWLTYGVFLRAPSFLAKEKLKISFPSSGQR